MHDCGECEPASMLYVVDPPARLFERADVANAGVHRMLCTHKPGTPKPHGVLDGMRATPPAWRWQPGTPWDFAAEHRWRRSWVASEARSARLSMRTPARVETAGHNGTGLHSTRRATG